MARIVLEHVSKTFRHRPALFNFLGQERSGQTQALQDVSLEVSQGTVLALLGPNGGGKTTTLKLISTMLLADQGRVLVADVDASANATLVRRQVGFAVAVERSFFPRLTGRENLDFFATMDEVPRQVRSAEIDRVFRETGLSDAADTLAMKYSSGMYQRLAIARALLKSPSILLLDEPTRSLDPGAREHLWDSIRALRAKQITMVIATHNLDEAVALGDSVAVLQAGRVVGRKNISGSALRDLQAFYFSSLGKGQPVEGSKVEMHE
jgi:ABC-2 type transport system ATP-binding protein